MENIKNDRLECSRSKNGEIVKNKLPSSALKQLGERASDESFIFNLPSDTTITKWIAKWIENANINKHITCYCSRHTFAVMNLRAGTNLAVIAKLMGHSNISFTLRYLNFIEDDKDKAIDNLIDISNLFTDV